MDEKFIALADLGSSKIALTVAKVTGELTEVLYYKEEKSEGIRHGSIFNPTKASESLRIAVTNAEKELGIKIKQLVTNMPRGSVRQESTPAQIDRGPEADCITEAEVEALKNVTLDNYPLDDIQKEQIYGAVAQSFSTDDMIHASEEDIVGVCSDRLDGNFRIFIGAKKPVDNIARMANLAGLGIARKIFTPEAVGRAVLNDSEMENGVGVIEIGAGVTSVSIFEDNILRYYASIPFGGNTITNDIKMECNIRGALAENIKLAFGACQPDKLQTMAEKILLITNEESGTTQKLPVKYLSEIITCRMHEIIQAALFLVQASGYADKLRGGLVVTGGCASLVNCANMIKDESGYNVRVGYPRTRYFSLTDCPGFGENGSAASVGMLMMAREDQYLNCLEAAPAKVAPKKETAPEAAPAEEGPAAAKPARTSKPAEPDIFTQPEPEKTQDDEEEDKEKKEDKKEKNTILVTWGRAIKGVLGDAWNHSVGGYYDEMQ